MALSLSRQAIIISLCAVMVLPGCLRRTAAMGAAVVSTAAGAATSVVTTGAGAAASAAGAVVGGGVSLGTGSAAAGSAPANGLSNAISPASRAAALNVAAASPVQVSSPAAALRDVTSRCLLQIGAASAFVQGYSYVLDTSIEAASPRAGTIEVVAAEDGGETAPADDDALTDEAADVEAADGAEGLTPGSVLSGLVLPGAGCEFTSRKIAQSIAFRSTLTQAREIFPRGVVIGGPDGQVGPCNGFTFDIDGARKAWLRFTAALDLSTGSVQNFNNAVGLTGTSADCDLSGTNVVVEIVSETSIPAPASEVSEG